MKIPGIIASALVGLGIGTAAHIYSENSHKEEAAEAAKAAGLDMMPEVKAQAGNTSIAEDVREGVREWKKFVREGQQNENEIER